MQVGAKLDALRAVHRQLACERQFASVSVVTNNDLVKPKSLS